MALQLLKNTKIHTYELERGKAPVPYSLILLKNCIIVYRGLSLIKQLGAFFFHSFATFCLNCLGLNIRGIQDPQMTM